MPRLDLPTLTNGGALFLLVAVVFAALVLALGQAAKGLDGEDGER